MDLRRIASSFENTLFDGYNEGTQTWTTAAMQGKVAPIDRFLSNFDRPTHRRMIGMDPAASVPVSNTVRVPSTGEVFLVGRVRRDDSAGTAYDTVAIGHQCFDTCIVNRKAPTGPSDNPGHLVNSQIGHHYVGIELRAVQEQVETHQDSEAMFFLVLPPHADVGEWDQITIGTDNYHVKAAYGDSGFTFCRAAKRADPRQNFTYHRRTASADYDPATGTVTPGLTDYNVTGFEMQQRLVESDMSPVNPAGILLVVQYAHIGFAPVVRDEVTWGGVKYQVSAVSNDFLQQQYQIRCVL